jgi:hypothetical protein
MVMSPAGHGPENDCADEAQQELQTTDPSSHQRIMTSRVQLKTKSLIVFLEGLGVKTN